MVERSASDLRITDLIPALLAQMLKCSWARHCAWWKVGAGVRWWGRHQCGTVTLGPEDGKALFKHTPSAADISAAAVEKPTQNRKQKGQHFLCFHTGELLPHMTGHANAHTPNTSSASGPSWPGSQSRSVSLGNVRPD